MGVRSQYYILNHIDSLQGAIVEIGCGRGEGSTDFFAGLVVGCKQFNHYAVDFDPEAYGVAKRYADVISNSHAYMLTGEEFLSSVFSTLNEKICYAYLDNFDYNYDPNNPPWWVQGQIQRYKEFDIDMTNENSEKAHLTQAQLIVPYAADCCIVHLDDTFLQNDRWHGKGATAVPWLIDNNWKIVYSYSNTVALSNF
jgi:hypothetical protein